MRVVDNGFPSAMVSRRPPSTAAPSSFKSLPTYKLDQLSALMSRQGELLYHRRFGLHITECRVLAIVRTHQPVALGGVCEELDLDKSHVSRIVARLIAARLLERHADPADQRSFYLAATPEGERLVQRINAAAVERNRAWTAGFGSAGEAQAFVETLDRLTARARALIADEALQPAGDRSPVRATRPPAAGPRAPTVVLVEREELESMRRRLADWLGG